MGGVKRDAGIAGIVLGLLIRAGLLRNVRGGLWYGIYRNSTWPWRRNGPFTLIPLGVAVFAFSAAVLALDGGHRTAGLRPEPRRTRAAAQEEAFDPLNALIERSHSDAEPRRERLLRLVGEDSSTAFPLVYSLGVASSIWASNPSRSHSP